MTTPDTTLHDLTSEAAVVEQASNGVTLAVDELIRRHGEVSWQLALAITGDRATALTAATNGMASALTAVHTGRVTADHFLILLLTHVRNAAVDLTDADADAIDDSLLASALADVPERWRSATWLSVVTQLSGRDVAEVIGLSHDETIGLIGRARMGIRQRYLGAHLAESGDRNCSRAVARLGAAVDHTLPSSDMEKVERHLRLCAGCTERRALLVTLPADLAALAGPPPAALVDKVRAAVAPLAAPQTATGMSPRTEKVLAGVSAFAAAVGVLGAVLFGLDNSTDDRHADLAVAPVAPLLDEIVTPGTVDLSSAIEFPATTIARRAAEAEQAAAAEGSAAGAEANGPSVAGSAEQAATHDTSPNVPVSSPEVDDLLDDDGSDSVVVGLTIPVVDVPVAVEVGPSPDDIGATVGPISVGSEPDPEDSVASSAPVDEVTEAADPVTETVSTDPAPLASATDSLGL